MSTSILSPTLTRILEGYGVKVASTRKKKANEAQEGVDSKLQNETDGIDTDAEALFNEESVPGLGQDKQMVPSEGGNPIADGMLPDATTPSGESPTFENALLGEKGWGTEDASMTQDEPGYSDGATPDSDLSITGSTDYKQGAAFIAQAKKFAATQKSFVTKIAAMAKFAEGVVDEAAVAADAPVMEPEAAMAAMAAPGQPIAEEELAAGGSPEGELAPEDAALVEAIIETQLSEDPLSPEEVAQIQAILGASPEEEALLGDPGLAADPMLGDPAMGVGDPMLEAAMAEEAAMMDPAMALEPPLAPEEMKMAQALLEKDLTKEAQEVTNDREHKDALLNKLASFSAEQIEKLTKLAELATGSEKKK